MRLKVLFTKIAVAFAKPPSRRNPSEAHMASAGLCMPVHSMEDAGIIDEDQWDKAMALIKRNRPADVDPDRLWWFPCRGSYAPVQAWKREYDLRRARVAMEIAKSLKGDE